MAGHSHSKNIKIRKAAVDAKRSKLFSKMSRLIMMAARDGGGDPKANAKLAFAINKAKSVSLPKDVIEKAIKKATGELDGDKYEELDYEGYGPAGVAVLCEVLTDNRNRTAGEVRKIFDVAGGKLGTSNCVAWMFQRKGSFLIESTKAGEEQLMELALEAGADDMKRDGDYFVILCDVTQFDAVQAALDEAGIEPDEADLVRIPDTLVDCDEETAKAVTQMLDALDDHDDIQNVFSNANLPEEALSDA